MGKSKDESDRLTIIGLRQKMCSILKALCEEMIKKAKGVKMAVGEKGVYHELYEQCLNERIEMKHKEAGILSRCH